MQNEEQLIIIGNGFDLNNGLKSSFQDFFVWLNNNNNIEKETIWGKNFWNSFFEKAQLSDPTWFDVEKQIGEVVEYLQTEFEKDEYSNPTYTDAFGLEQSSLHHHIVEKSHKICSPKEDGTLATIKDNILPLIVTNRNNIFFSTVDDIMNFLFSELNILENFLNEYLSQEVNSNQEYAEITENKLLSLAKLGVSRNDYKVKVLTFNYTPIQVYNKLQSLPVVVKNVHGELTPVNKGKSNLILGIDQSLLSNDDNLKFSIIEFTKTYRTLFLKKDVSIDRGSFINKNIKVVKFYGHSLGSADYSYFQSIFDELDIYNQEVYLFFYYSNYDDVDRGSEQYERVYKLMAEYGQSMSNSSQGKNLLHKMQLENRISIIPIK